MFSWFKAAAKCYVYMSDVSVQDPLEDDQIKRSRWEPAFRQSRWFTGVWTLQELLAPPSVEFFFLDGIRLGDKRSLEKQIHEIKGVCLEALRGGDLL